MRITVDTRQIERYERDLDLFAKRALPHAAKAATNDNAFDARRIWQEQIRETLITRNTYTERSIKVEKAKGLRLATMRAVVGAEASYMDELEFGGSKTSKGKEGVPLTTTVASGEGQGVQPRRQLGGGKRGRGKLALRNIRLGKENIRARSKRQAIFIKSILAVDSGRKTVFIDNGRKQAIFKITGGKKKQGGKRTKLRMRMLYDLSKRFYTIPKHPTLEPTLKKVEAIMPANYLKALKFQVKRHNLFTGRAAA